jgi:outer membrane protein OmpA-like peptidoglycan-associated protein
MKKIYILSLLFSFGTLFAQKNLKKADELFKNYSYVDASKAYEECLRTIKRPSIQTLRNTADSYYFISDNTNALRWYQKLYEKRGKNISDTYFLRYIQMMKAEKDYDQAYVLTKERLDLKKDQKKIAEFLLQQKQLDSLAKAKSSYSIKNLDINTDLSDFGAAFYGDRIVFSSAKNSTESSSKVYNWNKQPFLNLYVAERNPTDGSLFNEKFLLPNVSTDYHEATATFSSDWRTIYYTTNVVKKNKLVTDKSQINHFQIIRGTVVNEELIKPEKLPFDSNEYSVGHPSLSEDGKWLFFASDMQGGYGETDLYVVEIDDDGTMGSPRNLGPTINTIGDDLFPFYRNGTLYFSSDGHYGWGDLDVYESKFTEGFNFSVPKNLGALINSNKDDFSFIIDASGSYGYFSSSRDNGKGDDDIYYFTKTGNQLISGKVLNSKSKVGIEHASVKVYDNLGYLVAETTTNSQGIYSVNVPTNKKLTITAFKIDFNTVEKQFETDIFNNKETKDVNLELSKYEELVVKKDGVEKVDINPIFFDLDKSTVTNEASIELDKVVFIMDKFPALKIKIESHGDSRGKDAYNMRLSDDRAKATQAYIISKGIDASRIESAIGYGESRLINRCSNGVKCTEKEHFKNRRSDFIVTQK